MAGTQILALCLLASDLISFPLPSPFLLFYLECIEHVRGDSIAQTTLKKEEIVTACRKGRENVTAMSVIISSFHKGLKPTGLDFKTN